MPRRSWCILFAAFGLVLAALAYAQPVSDNPTASPSPNQSQTEPSDSRQPSLPIATQDAIQRIAGALETQNAKEPSADDKDRARRDLAAQEGMAKWAKWMFGAAFVETLITALGVCLVYWTLRYTRDAVEQARKATIAANETLDHARDTSRRELRAYLSVEPRGINMLIGESQECMGHIAVRNVGKLPASNVAVAVRMTLKDNRMHEFDPLEDHPEVERTIQPGAELVQGCKEEDIVNPMRIFKFGGEGYVFVWGTVYYGDGFGDGRRHVKFCHRYNVASFNHSTYKFFIRTKRIVETLSVIDADKGRYHDKGNDSD